MTTYNDIITKKGKLKSANNLSMEHSLWGNDVELVEQMYGMIWYLGYAGSHSEEDAAALVKEAKEFWDEGMNHSPGRQKS